ncbi:MAG TPA: glycosyltransferase family 2 protein, partial [Longimicrobium sp.]
MEGFQETARSAEAPAYEHAAHPAPAREGRPGGLADVRPPRPRVAVVIPAYRAASTVADVVARVPAGIWRIYVVDDGCPEATGDVAAALADPRVHVLRNPRNLGVGGAMKRGYARALRDGAGIVVKLDADGQMDPAFIPLLVAPLLAGRADYAKGNRFAPPHRTPRG